MAQKDQIGGDSRGRCKDLAKAKTSAEGVRAERRACLGVSGPGGTVSPRVPGADGHASFPVESLEGLGQSSGVRATGGACDGCSLKRLHPLGLGPRVWPPN